MAPKKSKSKRPAKKSGNRRANRRTNLKDFGSLSSKLTITPAGGGNYQTNVLYSQMASQLADHPRAIAVARGYQYYRIKSIRLTYKFPYDTFQQAVGGNSKPNFYYMLDKSGSLPVGINLESLKAMGARPRQVDEKPISITWSPSVLGVDETFAGPLPARYTISPWLSTNVQNVSHLGVYWYVDQMFAGGTQYQAELECQFEFKKPLWGAASSAPAIRSVPAILDNSPDGVVGGGDEHTIAQPT